MYYVHIDMYMEMSKYKMLVVSSVNLLKEQ